jgi:signal peptidase I
VVVRGEERVLGQDEWFVLGDNVSESTDSRDLGPVPRQDIVGRVWFRY